MNRVLFVVIVFIISVVEHATCAKILGVWILPGKSHFILGNTLMKGLAEAGHDVTLISPFEDKIPPKRGSYRNVVVPESIPFFENMLKDKKLLNTDDGNSIITPFIWTKLTQPAIDFTMNNTNVQKLLKSGEKFDAVIIEQFSNDCLKGLASHFNAHQIVYSSIGPTEWVNDIVGNPSPIAYIPQLAVHMPSQMTFLQRAFNTWIYIARRIIVYGYSLPTQASMMHKFFPEAPDFYSVYTNASLVLLNAHSSLYRPVPITPNMVEIGGYHIKPPKKLPVDLQKLLDDAEDGVVYFSMGSNIRSKDFPDAKREILVKAFAKLKQKVLWKWEADVLPGKPNNVETKKWMPQTDILAHPNVKLFITHGGLLSTMEAIYHGKPLLAIPVFGDQTSNAIIAEQNGYARMMPFHGPDFSEEKLSSLIQDILTNPKYSENAKLRSKIFHDRPMKPMDVAIYWVEYVIRTNGAHHLKVLGSEIPWYQYYLLDVLLFFAVLIVSVLTLCVIVLKWIIAISTKSKKRKED